jgi:hypothetical protein
MFISMPICRTRSAAARAASGHAAAAPPSSETNDAASFDDLSFHQDTCLSCRVQIVSCTSVAG